MLHRSFKPAKCKTSLKLSVSRIKLLKNKKASQVLQLRRELAKLLESGQDQTARIRVEHLVREEKTIAAYDLIEIYCELIAARLPIIESQKNCPIDLKEAITSVIFASPRCSEILELLDVRKQFTAKYGKEFISSVVELRPECGVNRSLVEKLSAIAPDGKTKIKILSAIAEEHNIQWVPTSFGEKQPTIPEDLLNGPNSLEKSSKMYAETLPARDQKHVVPADLNAQNARSSASIQHDASAEHDSNRMKSPSNFHLFRSGVGSDEMEFRRESSWERNEFYVDRKDWNMEFKDATSAAQAAAESAERASMAARAAAELSNQERTVRQYSRESQKSSVASKLSDEHRLKDPSNSFSHCNNPRTYNEKTNEDEKDNMGGVVQASSRDDGNTKRYSGVASFKSNATSTDEDLSLHNFQKEVRYPRKNDYEEEYMKFEKGNSFEVSRKEQASKFVGSNFTHDLSEDLSNSFSDGKNPWLHTERTNGKEKDNMGRAAEASPRDDDNTNGYSGIASFKSYEVSIDEDLLANSFQNAGRYPHMNDFEVESMKPEKGNSFDEGGRKEQASEFVVRLQDGLETENVDYTESSFTKQSSTVSTSGNADGESSNYQGHGNGDRYKGFFVDVHQTDLRAKTEPANSYDNVAAVFDDSASDEDEHRFNLGHDHIEQKTYFRSPNRKSQCQNSVNPKAWSPTRDENESAFSHFTTESYHISQLPESRNKPSVTIESEDIAAVRFDESNGPSSESEVEVDKPKLIERMDEKRLLPQQTTYAAKSSDSSLSWSHHGVAASSFKETDHTVSVDKFSHSDSLSSRPSSRHPKLQLEYPDEVKHPQTLQKSRISFTGGLEDNTAHPEVSHDAAQDIEVSDGEKKYLNFGTLMGGRRNKGYKHPPYVKNPSSKASSSQLMFKDDLISSADSTNPEVIIQEPIDKETRPKVNMEDTSRAPVSYLNSTDSSDEEFPQKPLSSNLEPSKQKVGMKEGKTSRGRAAPITYFDSDGDDSEYNFGPSSANRNRSGSGISQRTKVSPPDSRRSSYPNVKAGDGVSIAPDYGSERKASRRSMATETRPKHQPNDTSSSHWGSSKPIPKSKFSMHTEGSNAPGKEQTSSRETPLKEGSTKASHVHPKLPDFDTISAQLASIRLNRKY